MLCCFADLFCRSALSYRVKESGAIDEESFFFFSLIVYCFSFFFFLLLLLRYLIIFLKLVGGVPEVLVQLMLCCLFAVLGTLT